MEQTQRHRLPFIVPGQAQKEMTHNEALAAIDLLLNPVVREGPRDAPPVAPDGGCWLVGPAPTGAWAGMAGTIASHGPAGWRHAQPSEGLIVAVGSGGDAAQYRAGGWRMIAAAAIAAPTGGATVDAPAREAIGAILEALRARELIAPAAV